MAYRKVTSNDATRRWGRRYPWDVWFQQDSFVLERGIHYVGRTDTMMQQVRHQASQRGLRVKLTTDDGGTIIIVVVVEVLPLV